MALPWHKISGIPVPSKYIFLGLQSGKNFSPQIIQKLLQKVSYGYEYRTDQRAIFSPLNLAFTEPCFGLPVQSYKPRSLIF